MLGRRRTMRSNPTAGERAAWVILRQLKNLGIKMRRQHSIGPYIADFCCPSAKLVVEIDGKIHLTETIKNNDAIRTRYLNALGYEVIRFTNEEVFKEPEKVIRTIFSHCQNPSPTGGKGQG